MSCHGEAVKARLGEVQRATPWHGTVTAVVGRLVSRRRGKTGLGEAVAARKAGTD